MYRQFIWTEEHSVGVAEFDEQHKHFFDICNDLFDLAIGATFSKEAMLVKVAQLGSYANYHLFTEEELFEKIKYPGSAEHTKEHDMFRAKVRDFIDRSRDDTTDLQKLSREVAEFAAGWLFDHILFMDKKYTKFFNEHGIK
jgi:hemerythrin